MSDIMGTRQMDAGNDHLAAPLTAGSVTTGAGSLAPWGDGEQAWLVELVRVWGDHQAGNILRSDYYDGRERLELISDSIPNRIRLRARCTVGWPRKAVSSLADKSRLAGFNVDADVTDPGVKALADRVGLIPMMSQAITSAYKHCCSFLTCYPDSETGDVQVVARSADWSSAVWDRRRNRIAAALTVTDDDRLGRATGMTLWLPGRAWELERDGMGWTATCTWLDSACPVVPVVPIAYDRQLDRPFGRSRITRTLMALTDMGFRTMVRMDTTADFYCAPRLWFLGLDPDAFTQSKWSTLITGINAVSRDEDGQVPQMQQVSQSSMSPHGDMLETIAMLVSSETDIPAEALGIRLSNPTSVEAINAAEQRLSRIAERQNTEFTGQLMHLMRIAMYMQGGYKRLADVDLTGISPVWEPVNVSSDAAKADWLTKVGSVNQAIANSDVGLRRLGLDDDEIRCVHTWESRQRAMQSLDKLRAKLASGENGDAGSGADGQ